MDKIWRGKWIIEPDFYGLAPINVFGRELDKHTSAEHREDLKNHHVLIRKEFTIAKDFEQAFLDITADDYYKLYVNGEYVGQGPAPSYYFHYYYNQYNLKEYLHKGKNVIAVHVYYQGLLNRVYNSADYRQGMIAELKLDEQISLATDSSWKYKVLNAYQSGGIIGYDTQFLENIDCNQLIPNWHQLQFNDSKWKNVMEKVNDDHKLYLQSTPIIQVYEVKPEHVEKIASGHYFLDFGQEITAHFKMEVAGFKGEKIELRFAEELLEGENNQVRFNMRCNCKYQEFWTLSDREKDLVENYDYKGFRYMEVIGPDSALQPESFTAIVRHYPLTRKQAEFNSSDELLNKVWSICKNGVKYGVQEGYLDCPTREKGQYLGDCTITAQSHLYLSGDLRLYKKVIKDFALSTFVSPGLMAVAPGSLMQEIADYSMQWPLQVLNYYQHSGEEDFLAEMYPIIENLLGYYQQYEREDGLLEEVSEQWNLVDWPSNLRDDYDFNLDKPIGKGCHNVVNAFYLGMVKTINQIRDILNIKYEDKFPLLLSSFINTFYDSQQKLFVDAENSQHTALHSNVLPLYFNYAPLEAKTEIVQLIREKGLKCGVYMAYFLLKALAEAQEYELIFDLIVSDDYWVNMVKEGGTSCFEAWGKAEKWNTSLCHPWASAPIIVIIEDIIGLKPAKEAWEEINFSPQIPKTLKEIHLKIKVKTGEIKFDYQDEKIKIKGPQDVKIKQDLCSGGVFDGTAVPST